MKSNKYLAAFVVIVLAVGVFFYFKGKNSNNAGATPDQAQTPAADNQTSNSSNTMTPPDATNVPDSAIATVDTNLGSFEITLDGKDAPQTVANFIKLAQSGFYDNLTFHRIVEEDGFHLIQGGDPNGDGTGGPGYTIPAEIGLKHTKGAIAMARTSDSVNPDRASSGSQFYITLEDIPALDGQYTVFGYVTSGMDVVEKIGSVPVTVNPQTGENSMPVQKVIINKITIK